MARGQQKDEKVNVQQLPETDRRSGVTGSGSQEMLTALIASRSHLFVRPSACPSECKHPVHINVTYNVIQLMAFTQTEETITISGWFTMQWIDYRLRWNMADFDNVTNIDYVGDRLWKPDIGLMNGKISSSFDFSLGQHSRLNVESTGRITWLYGTILDVVCPLDFAQFPFDTQMCYLILTPWQSSTRQLHLQPLQHGPTVDNNYLPNSNVSEWEIQSVRFSLESYSSQFNVSYQYIKVSIKLKRQPLYFIIMVLIPFSMLSILACLIFTLEDTGDRLSVALSLILSMTMYVVIVSSNAPRSMRTVPLLGIFLLIQLGLLCSCTLVAVMTRKLSLYVGQPGPDGAYGPQCKCFRNCLHGRQKPSSNNHKLTNHHGHYTSRMRHPNGSIPVYSPIKEYDNDREFEAIPCKVDESFQGSDLDDHSETDSESNVYKRNTERCHHSFSFSDGDTISKSSMPPEKTFGESLQSCIQYWSSPKSLQTRRKIAALADNIGIVIYLFTTLFNAIFCLVIMRKS